MIKRPLPDEADDFSEEPLSSREVQMLRLMIERELFAGKVWGLVRKGLVYITVFVGGIVTFRQALKDIWLWIVK